MVGSVQADAKLSGGTIGKWVAQNIPEGQVACIMGLPGRGDAETYRDAFQAEMEKNPKLKLVASVPGDWNRQKAFNQMQNLITSFPNLKAVFVQNEDMALGAIQALKEAGKEGQVAIVSQNGAPYGLESIAAGGIKATVGCSLAHHLGWSFFDTDTEIEAAENMRITEIFAPELALRQYWPVKNIKDADLLIVVHWGTTAPPVSAREMDAQSSPLDSEFRPEGFFFYRDFLRYVSLVHETDNMSNQAAYQRTSQLLGYTRTLNDPKANSAATDALTGDVGQARYFIILKAYDLRASTPAARSRAVWTLHLNMGSPGNNFGTALDYMAWTAVNYFGRSSDGVEAIKPSREGKVEIGPSKVIEMPVSTTPPADGK